MITININISELKRLLEKEAINLIDIRSNYKYSCGTIANARNISVDELLYNANKYLKKDESYYIFCDSGSRSLKLSKILNTMGYRVYNISGGYYQYLVEK